MGTLSGFVDGLLIVSAVVNAGIGVVVLSRNKRSRLNQYFFSFSAGVAAWSVTNIIFQIVPLQAKYPVALISYTSAILLGIGFFLLSREINGRSHTLFDRVLLVAGTVVAVSALIPGLLATGVSASASIEARTPLLAIYGIVLLALILGSLKLLLHNLRHTVGAEHARVRLILMGFSAAACIGLLCNLVLPLLGTYTLVAVGPSGSLVLVAATAYAIIRHRLFDVRAFVARTIAYIASIVVLAGMYGVVVFGVVTRLLHLRLPMFVEVTIVIATAIVALNFSALKQFFDRISDKIFYRDAYDVQELLDRLNRLFVDSTDLGRLLGQSAKALEEALKPEFCAFSVSGQSDVLQRITGSGQEKLHLDLGNIDAANSTMLSMHRKLIVTDELENHPGLQTTLESNDIAILGVLTSSATGNNKEVLGYLILGYRRSGNSYNDSDLRILEIIVNELVIAVQNALRLEEIRHFNETLQGKVDDATHQLRHVNERLKQLDETKDEFITMASHQLRTPLTSVKGYLSMVLEGDAGKLNANQKKLLEQSFLSSQRMVYLISDLLNLSRLNTGKFVIEPSAVDLSEVVQVEVDQLAETAKARDLNLIYHKPDSFPKLMLDETKTHQVVMNFIDNAIYYTPSGGTVTVTLRETPTAVECTVKDNGIGVPKAVQHKLFTKFYRAQNAQQARPDGTGLGLFMAKKVVAAQGGLIIFESEEGKGSTFGFRFNKASKPVSAGAGGTGNSQHAHAKKAPVHA